MTRKPCKHGRRIAGKCPRAPAKRRPAARGKAPCPDEVIFTEFYDKQGNLSHTNVRSLKNGRMPRGRTGKERGTMMCVHDLYRSMGADPKLDMTTEQCRANFLRTGIKKGCRPKITIMRETFEPYQFNPADFPASLGGRRRNR